jgi:cell wall-associated NlpC family hydrolase
LNQVQRLLRVLLCALIAIGAFLPATVASADPSPQDVEKQLDKANDDLELVIEDYNRVGEELKATQAAADAINLQLAPMQAQLDAAQADVARMAKTAYKSGGNLANAQLLLTATSTGTMVAQVDSMQRVARARKHDLAVYTGTKAKYETEKRRLDNLLADGQRKRADLTARRTTIEAQVKSLEDQERRLQTQQASRGGGTSTRPPGAAPPPPPPPPAVTGRGAAAVRFAYAQLGKMYQFGADGPNTFDCSGLTMMAWKAAGVNLPHNAAMQFHQVRHVSASQLQPGDLVFSNSLGHVQIYIGNGQVIHASRAGRPIAIASLNTGSANGFGRPG